MNSGPVSGSCEEGNCHLCEAVGCQHDCHKSPGAHAARLGKLAFDEYSKVTVLTRREPANWFYLPQLERNGWIAAAQAVVASSDKARINHLADRLERSPVAMRGPLPLINCWKCAVLFDRQTHGDTTTFTHPEDPHCPVNGKQFTWNAFGLREVTGGPT